MAVASSVSVLQRIRVQAFPAWRRVGISVAADVIRKREESNEEMDELCVVGFTLFFSSLGNVDHAGHFGGGDFVIVGEWGDG